MKNSFYMGEIMSKSILIIDTPERCSMCKFMRNTDEEYHYCRVLGFDYQVNDYMRSTPKGKPDWCPLKAVPEKRNVVFDDKSMWAEQRRGWNACIEEILGENK